MSEIAPGIATSNPSPRSRRTYIVLGLLAGCFGIHNFYARRYLSGALQLLTTLCLGWVLGLGLLLTSIWALLELFYITQDGAGVPFTK